MKKEAILILSLNLVAAFAFGQTLNSKIIQYSSQFSALQNDLKTLATQNELKTDFTTFDQINLKSDNKNIFSKISWTRSDQEALKKKHQDIIKNNLKKTELESKKLKIDLNLVRKQKSEGLFCKNLPKGGMLHVHPWGTLNEETLQLILEKQNPLIDLAKFQELIEKGFDENLDGRIDSQLPQKNSLDLAKRLVLSQKTIDLKIRYSDLSIEDKKDFHNLFFITHKTENFNEFMAVFSLIFANILKKDSFSDPAFNVESAMWDAFLKRSQQEKVSYIEVTQTVNPKFGIQKFSNFKSSMQQKYGIIVNTLAAFDRRKKPAEIYSQLKSILALPLTDAIVGINLVANEDLHPARDFQETYSLLAAKRKTTHPDLHATIHAGEIGDVENVRNALLMGAERIGHGIQLKNDLLTLEYARTEKIPIEVNLSSNLYLNTVKSFEAHPFLMFLRLGLPINISTDDEGIFKTTMSKECELIISKSDINYFELKEVMLNSIRSSFANATEKEILLKKLQLDFLAFEKQQKNLK